MTMAPTAGRMAQAPSPPFAQVAVQVRNEFDVAAVIAAVTRCCAGQGMNAVFTAHVATAASELANNLWMYAQRGGLVRLALCERAGQAGVELVVEDDGPGIDDVALALTDGYSTAGGMGCGLPGAQRLMDEFEIVSRPGLGTRVVARKWSGPVR